MIRQRTQDRLVSLISTGDRRIPDHVWQKLDAQQKIEELTGHSLDECRNILDLPQELMVRSPTVMTGKVQVIRALFNCVTKIGLESRKLLAMQDEILNGLIADFDFEEAKGKPNGRGDRDH